MSSEDRRRICWLAQRANSPILCLSVLFRPSAHQVGTHPLWLRQSSLFLLPVQMLISSGHTLTDTPRNKVWSAIWASLSPNMLTYKINYHNLI